MNAYYLLTIKFIYAFVCMCVYMCIYMYKLPHETKYIVFVSVSGLFHLTVNFRFVILFKNSVIHGEKAMQSGRTYFLV